ncbi:MAG: hypothetical protein R3A79_24535 [Nannocystaceae bacterium]
MSDRHAPTRDALRELFDRPPSATTPALLELCAQQARGRRPAALVEQRRRDRFVEPSSLDLRLAHALDGLALAAARDYEALLLSPVAPLGSCSVVAPTAQDRTLSALRGTEVVSDPTNVLAIECAHRMRSAGPKPLRLCTIHQVLRAQPVPPVPGFSRHFRLFALADAGRSGAADGFEVDAVVRQLGVYDRLFDAAAALGCAFPERRAVVHATAETATLGDRVAAALRERAPVIAVERAELDSPYYAGLRVLFGAARPDGAFAPIVDVGRFDWLAALAANRKLRYVASGCGLQLLPTLFAAG